MSPVSAIDATWYRRDVVVPPAEAAAASACSAAAAAAASAASTHAQHWQQTSTELPRFLQELHSHM